MHLLILEDDPVWKEVVETTLKNAGHSYTSCLSVAAMKSSLRQDSFDLLLLDWNLPDGTGYDLMLWTKERLDSPPPIIMVTSRSDSNDIVQALGAGADDFIIKPCEPQVLAARIAAVMRRVLPQDQPSSGIEQVSSVTFDHGASVVEIGGQTVKLTEKEFSLALMLFRNMGRPMGRTHLLERIWGTNPDIQTRTLDVHVSKIRNRLGLRAEKGFRLLPVYNFGYRLEQMAQTKTLEEAE